MKVKKKLLTMLAVIALLLSYDIRSSCAETQTNAIQSYDLPQETLVDSAAGTVRHSRISYISFYNIGRVTREALRKAAFAALDSGGKVFVNFDTLAGKEVSARITVNPLLVKSAEGAISFIVDTSAKTNDNVKKKFERLFKKPVAVMRCEQTEDFGMPVVISGKLDLSGMDKGKLIAYSYSPDKNEYALIENSKCSVDGNGFIYLQSGKGGYIVITSEV